MAKLPEAADLQRLRAPAETPGFKIKEADYGAIEKGSKALVQGGQQLGAGFEALGKAQDEIDDYATMKKLLDFKIASEMELENFKREMPVGGGQFADAWANKYREMARTFVGKDDANIPPAVRQKIGLALKQQEITLQERAIREQNAEMDRAELDGLNETLNKTKSFVEADPNRLEEMRKEGRSLIETSRLTPAGKHKALAAFDKEVEKTAAITRLMKAQTVEEYDALKRDLAPDAPDKRLSGDVTNLLGKGKPTKAAGWARSDPTWNALNPYQKAAAMALMEANAADANDAKNALGSMINRAAKEGQDLGAHVSQAIYQPTFEPAQQRRLAQIIKLPAFQELTAWAERRVRGEEADPVNGATHFLAHEPVMLGLEAREPGKYSSWRGWTGFDSATRSYSNVKFRDKSHAFLSPDGEAPKGEPVDEKDAYSGPYSRLPLSERKTLWTQAETQRAKQINGINEELKQIEQHVASNGNFLPDEMMDTLKKRVEATGDPALKTRFNVTFGLAAETRRLQQMPPPLLEQYTQNLRRQAEEKGITPEQQKYIDHVQKIEATAKRSAAEDAMAWAEKTRINLPVVVGGGPDAYSEPLKLRQLNFGAKDIDGQLSTRMEQAKKVSDYYQQPVQAFTKIERDALRATLQQGGQPMLYVMGKIASAAANAGMEPEAVLREFTKDAPEVGLIGELVANNGDRNTLDTAAKALAWKASMKENFKSSLDRAQVKPDIGEYAEVMKTTPMKVDAVHALADLIYEYESRQKGKGIDKFDNDLYKDIVGRVMGKVTTPDGLSYGGVGYQGRGWFDGKWQSQVLVPQGIRTDMFDDMVNALRQSDLNVLGAPRDSKGNAMTVDEVRRATWISVGPSQYVLKVGERSDGKPIVAGTGKQDEPYVLDARKIMDPLRRRKPELFMGYDGKPGVE